MGIALPGALAGALAGNLIVGDPMCEYTDLGPVICLYEYDELATAVRRANALPFAFHASVMSRDIDTALYAYKHLAASAVMINDHTAFRIDQWE